MVIFDAPENALGMCELNGEIIIVIIKEGSGKLVINDVHSLTNITR